MRLSSMADYAVVTMSAAARHCGGARVNAAQAGRGNRPAGAHRAEAGQPPDRGGPAALGARCRRRAAALRGPPAAITLADIVEAVEGPIALTACVDDQTARLRLEGNLLRAPALARGERDASRRPCRRQPDPALRREAPDDRRTPHAIMPPAKRPPGSPTTSTAGLPTSSRSSRPRACPKTPSASSRPRRTSRNGCSTGGSRPIASG